MRFVACHSPAPPAKTVISSLYHALFSPYRHVPGPFLARFTDAWYLYRVWQGHFARDNIALHRKYGPIVRYGPNRFSFDHPEATKTIYGIGTGKNFAKSPFYQAFSVPGPDRPSIFAHEDVKEHAALRRKYQGTHAMSALVSYEDFVDECADLFDQRLREMATQDNQGNQKPTVDISHWLQCYAFDVIGLITYSERLGFLDQGADIGGVMASLEGFIQAASLIGIYPWIHPILFAIRNWFTGESKTGMGYIIHLTQNLIAAHQKKPKNLDLDDENTSRMDFLSKYMARHRQDPGSYNSWYVLSGCASNMTAGSDTTGISLSAILHFLLQYPHTAQRLRQEVDDWQKQNTKSRHISFSDSQSMPYLQAVINEALRLHPATGLPLERLVPDQGATIAGQIFQPQTIVGVNTWVEHANPSTFGPDPEVFRPERWLDSDQEKVNQMNRHWMPFGMGARTCIGRHISILEISKLIPRIVRDFDFQLPSGTSPKDYMDTPGYWFVKPKGFRVHVKIRQW
ncbi:cytochrome P450 [Ilyonectria destructans]|nr:cytochrome P450 [Ilyonectria destructans]